VVVDDGFQVFLDAVGEQAAEDDPSAETDNGQG
jgi:hypothetical protein